MKAESIVLFLFISSIETSKPHNSSSDLTARYPCSAPLTFLATNTQTDVAVKVITKHVGTIKVNCIPRGRGIDELRWKFCIKNQSLGVMDREK